MMDKLETRDTILRAAKSRFGQFGFNKTTMAEIARDCRMSAGNLYRYFKNKEDIAVAITGNFFQSIEDEARDILVNGELASAARLESFVMVQLRQTYETFSNQPHIYDLIDYVKSERWEDLIEPHKGNMNSILRELLNQGVESGEFDVDDLDEATEHVATALKIFGLPSYISCFTLVELERQASGVVLMLYKGLRRA